MIGVIVGVLVVILVVVLLLFLLSNLDVVLAVVVGSVNCQVVVIGGVVVVLDVGGRREQEWQQRHSCQLIPQQFRY